MVVEVNIIRFIQLNGYTYQEMADRIKEATGKTYHPESLGRVARGGRPVSNRLYARLAKAFPEFFLDEVASNDGT